MKSVSLISRLCLSTAFAIGSVFNFFFAMDITFSSIAKLRYSLLYSLPVYDLVITLLWISFIACISSCAFTVHLVINKKASKKKVGYFLLLLGLVAIICTAIFDIAFSQKLGTPDSILFNLPTKGWMISWVALPGIILFLLFCNLFHQIVHVKDSGEEE